MTKWFKVYCHSLWHLLRLTKDDHRMCWTFDSGTFCNCGFGNGGVTFDQEIAHAVRRIEDSKR